MSFVSPFSRVPGHVSIYIYIFVVILFHSQTEELGKAIPEDIEDDGSEVEVEHEAGTARQWCCMNSDCLWG